MGQSDLAQTDFFHRFPPSNVVFVVLSIYLFVVSKITIIPLIFRSWAHVACPIWVIYLFIFLKHNWLNYQFGADFIMLISAGPCISSFHELEGAAFLSDQRIITVSGGDTLLFFLSYGAVIRLLTKGMAIDGERSKFKSFLLALSFSLYIIPVTDSQHNTRFVYSMV